jgi:hypothetical protein
MSQEQLQGPPPSGFDPSRTPVMPPPPGVTPNFTDPYSLARQCLAINTIFLALACVFVILRFYTRAWITRRVGWDDCKSIGPVLLISGIHTYVFEFRYYASRTCKPSAHSTSRHGRLTAALGLLHQLGHHISAEYKLRHGQARVGCPSDLAVSHGDEGTVPPPIPIPGT